MITLGVILLILGLIFFHPLFVFGIVVLIIGGILFAFSAAGREVGGRRYWF